jgi:hypothetical protein
LLTGNPCSLARVANIISAHSPRCLSSLIILGFRLRMEIHRPALSNSHLHCTVFAARKANAKVPISLSFPKSGRTLHVTRRVPQIYSLDGIFHQRHNIAMNWEVEFTNEFEAWWNKLSEDEQDEIDAKVHLLEEWGPTLPRPHSDRIHTSRHQNMKELRGKVNERHLRVLYAFDPARTAILLIGGDKTDDPKWYEKYVPIADDLLDQHLRQLEKERKSNTSQSL